MKLRMSVVVGHLNEGRKKSRLNPSMLKAGLYEAQFPVKSKVENGLGPPWRAPSHALGDPSTLKVAFSQTHEASAGGTEDGF